MYAAVAAFIHHVQLLRVLQLRRVLVVGGGIVAAPPPVAHMHERRRRRRHGSRAWGETPAPAPEKKVTKKAGAKLTTPSPTTGACRRRRVGRSPHAPRRPSTRAPASVRRRPRGASKSVPCGSWTATPRRRPRC
jgi:hypothetical protein